MFIVCFANLLQISFLFSHTCTGTVHVEGTFSAGDVFVWTRCCQMHTNTYLCVNPLTSSAYLILHILLLRQKMAVCDCGGCSAASWMLRRSVNECDFSCINWVKMKRRLAQLLVSSQSRSDAQNWCENKSLFVRIILPVRLLLEHVKAVVLCGDFNSS